MKGMKPQGTLKFVNLAKKHKNKPERVFGLQVRCRELDIFKIFEIFWIFWGDFFGGFFLGIFFEDFF